MKMGIRGLTTFINNRSHLYLEDYELHDCNVLIDGNSVASNLYKWHCKSNDCFGGDYDKFAHLIMNFFDLLSQCKINPYVILDGGYEKRKLKTVIGRMKNKIKAAEALNAVTEGSESVFPLFLREVFVDIVISLGLKLARCEFEGDMEIANIAKILDCPVISYDSDFYVFGCLYIPFSTVDLVVRKGIEKVTKKTFTYLPCKIYHIENFLQAFGGLDRDNLPLLAVLLGNDYVNGTLFAPFFRNLKMQKCSGSQSDQQKRIKSVIVWLQNENIETAIKTVLSRFKDARRQLVLRKIQGAMKGYFDISSDLLKYLHIETMNQTRSPQLDFNKLSTNMPNQENVGSSDIDKISDNENELDIEDDTLTGLDSDVEQTGNELPRVFQRNYRKCQYPACFMDMISLNRYYCVPQVEDSTFVHAHTISLDILNIMYKILTPNLSKDLKIIHRQGKYHISYASLPRPNIEVPTVGDIERFTTEEKKLLLLNLLSIDNKFSEMLEAFSVEWHLFLISLKYASDRGTFDYALIHSCIMCFIILHYVDCQVGFYRVSKTFDKKFSSSLSEIKSKTLHHSFSTFDALPFDECLIYMNKMIAYFQMDSKLKSNYRLYDKTLVHATSQIQSVFLHVKYLNSLLDCPFPSLEIHKIFDGTFLYNMTVNLRKRTNISEYLDLFLKECPCIMGGTKHILNMLVDHLNSSSTSMQAGRKHKKKKRKNIKCNVEDNGNVEEEDEMEAKLDPNNLYSILAVM